METTVEVIPTQTKKASPAKIYKLVRKFCKDKKKETEGLMCTFVKKNNIHICTFKTCPKMKG